MLATDDQVFHHMTSLASHLIKGIISHHINASVTMSVWEAADTCVG